MSRHPLDPLSEAEICKAANLIRGNNTSDLRFVAISLKEVPKKEFLAWETQKNAPLPTRLAEAITLDSSTGLAQEHIVNLNTSFVVETKVLSAGVQPLLTPDDCDLAEEIVQASKEVASVLKERYDITDMTRVACDPWSVHLASEQDKLMTVDPDTGRPRRLVQTFLYHRQYGNDMEDNHYAHPIDILPLVDLNTRQVVVIQGTERKPPPKIPTTSVQYHRNLLGTNSYLATSWREDTAKALNILQPDGPSFKVDGNCVEWQKWTFRVGFHYREGLVLHNVSYDGRPILYRASLVEMAVPYGDPHPPFTRKCAFDVGDYGLGYCANSLELGCDCLGHIHYFDTVLTNAKGEAYMKPKVVCMHEEDAGILWKHVEYRNGHNESRRARELVISSIATVVNYEYLFYWRLKQDGSIDFEIKLSGELSTNLLSADEDGEPTHGVLVSPGVNAQVHQHMFCARLDVAVDGHDNVVSQVDVVNQPVHPIHNPYGNAFGPTELVLETERQAICTADATKARTWKVSSASQRNPINNKATAYKLVPFTRGPAQPTVLVDHSTSTVATKGKFSTANLWVTPHSDTERYPAGEYTVQQEGKGGVDEWTAQDRSLVGQDVVLWHVFGVTHVPRIEDFPVMPCETTGFMLKPDNFFSGNPGVDLPPEHNKASKLANGCCA